MSKTRRIITYVDANLEQALEDRRKALKSETGLELSRSQVAKHLISEALAHDQAGKRKRTG